MVRDFRRDGEGFWEGSGGLVHWYLWSRLVDLIQQSSRVFSVRGGGFVKVVGVLREEWGFVQ